MHRRSRAGAFFDTGRKRSIPVGRVRCTGHFIIKEVISEQEVSMSDRNIAVKILGKTKEYPYGTPYAKIVEE